ncbi:hypothetical protein OF83DRAFT_1086136 [Amylostereum chailletii]|nr:hypothetical protein OF83DRAFT_1086136 [Amylostereum chailletii]
MFSFRSVVEGLAHTPRRPSQDITGHDGPDVGSRSVSLDGAAQFTESLSSLRKSFAPPRTGSPTPNSAAPTTSMDNRRAKRRLEDRLRASFAIGDASDASTPAASSRTSPAPSTAPDIQTSTNQYVHNPLSPTAVPLPQSPAVETDSVQVALTAPRLAHPLATPPSINIPLLNSISESHSLSSNPHPWQDRHLEANIPLPKSPPPEDILHSLHLDSISPNVPSPDDRTASIVDADGKHVSGETHEESVAKEDERRTEDAEEPQVKQSTEADIEGDPPSVPAVVIAETEENLGETNLVKHSSEATEEPAVLEPPETTVVSSRSPSPRGVTPDASNPAGVEAIRERLRLVEQRFSDVSTSFKRLQAEKLSADKVLQELTSVQSVQDADGLRDFLQNSQIKVEISQDEIRRLNGKLTRQEERMDELRETHRLESRSQVDLIDRLRKQIEEAEALIKANHGSSSQLEADIAKYKAELDHSHREIERLKASTKDEEEKRSKAITLLKTVRAKLTKAEKERDDAAKELASVKDEEQAEREKEKSERMNLQAQIERIKAEKEMVLSTLKAQYERELASVKEHHQKELADLRSQFDLETATTKSEHDQVVAAKNTRISGLEYSVQTLSSEKNSLFDQVQLRQAEVESSQSHLEVLQSQNTEFQYQLRELDDRVALLTEELGEARRDQSSRTRSPVNPAEDVARLLANAESRHETKLAELRRKLTAVEAERTEVEADWSRKLDEKVKEAEKWRHAVESSSKNQQVHDGAVEELREEIDRLKQEARTYRNQVMQLQLDVEQRVQGENGAKEEVSELNARIATIAQQVEDAKVKESQARALNKTLREELRKVQSSAALLERQRNPGVGYWGSRQEGQQDPAKPTSPPPPVTTSRGGSPAPGPASSNEEEVNLEYLRNVILQFLEHKEMRPNLVRVLSIILHFTPQETRRLIAKV